MQREFYTILQERNADGATVFLSSHVLSEVSRYCKNAAIIREGRLLVSDTVSNLGHTGVKRISLRGVKNMLEIKDIRDIKTQNDTISFLYGGRTDELVKILASASFEDINITDPDLDEVFMHYYVKEESK
jgi:ABC-2 type transport system ATP-binding protein